jgi:hypothetical protein
MVSLLAWISALESLTNLVNSAWDYSSAAAYLAEASNKLFLISVNFWMTWRTAEWSANSWEEATWTKAFKMATSLEWNLASLAWV